MKKKTIITIVILLLLLVVIIVAGIMIFNHNDKKEDTKSASEKSAKCQMELTATYGGYGIAGQDLGSGTDEESYTISKGDKFYEPLMGGIWIQNYEGTTQDSDVKIIIEVTDINEDSVTITKHIDKNYDNVIDDYETYNLKYDEELSVDSNTIVFDGINYRYSIKVTK